MDVGVEVAMDMLGMGIGESLWIWVLILGRIHAACTTNNVFYILQNGIIWETVVIDEPREVVVCLCDIDGWLEEVLDCLICNGFFFLPYGVSDVLM